MKNNSLFFGIIGTIAIAFAVTNVNSMQTKIYYGDKDPNLIEKRVLKKNDLLGTYTVKGDKNSNISLNNDGTYSLTINVCEKYLTLKGEYELADTKLKLKNNNYLYDDLDGNEELYFTIVDGNTIKSDESLVCTTQETLFEK